MKWSWRLATIRGIDIKVHVSFLLALAWGGYLWSEGSIRGAIYGVALTLVLFVIVLMHEMGHSVAAQHYGIPVYDIMLLPIGGVARLSHMPEKPSQELVVALAGPAVNLALVILLAPVLIAMYAARIAAGVPVFWPSMTVPGWPNFTAFLLMVNVSLLVFNMLPAFPMDGGRVLRALLAMRLKNRQATRIAVVVGRVFAIAFGVIAILTGNIFLGIVAFFIFQGASAEGQEVVAPQAPADESFEPSAIRPPALLADMPAYLAFDRLMRSPFVALPVVDEGGDLVGMVTRVGMESRWAAGVRGPVGLFVEHPIQVAHGVVSLEQGAEA